MTQIAPWGTIGGNKTNNPNADYLTRPWAKGPAIFILFIYFIYYTSSSPPVWCRRVDREFFYIELAPEGPLPLLPSPPPPLIPRLPKIIDFGVILDPRQHPELPPQNRAREGGWGRGGRTPKIIDFSLISRSYSPRKTIDLEFGVVWPGLARFGAIWRDLAT